MVAIHTKLKIVLLYDNDAIVNSLYVSRLFCEMNSVVTLRVATCMLASHSPAIHLVGGKILERVHTYIYTQSDLISLLVRREIKQQSDRNKFYLNIKSEYNTFIV